MSLVLAENFLESSPECLIGLRAPCSKFFVRRCEKNYVRALLFLLLCKQWKTTLTKETFLILHFLKIFSWFLDNWIFGQNGHFSTVFGQKRPIFFSKICLEHFFTFPKPYLSAKFQKKIMNGCLDICVMHIRTNIQGSTYRSVCGETKT